METQKDSEGKPIVKICSLCQNIFNSDYNVDQKIKNELKIVDQKVKENSQKINFTHGLCNPHLLQSYYQIPGITPERLNSVKEKLKRNNNPIPCLLTDDNLRRNYMNGIFTTEQLQTTNQSNEQLTIRFKKLAGI